MTLSFAGTFFYGYFFAFHLVNIVANNELLKGVIKAVTQNGEYGGYNQGTLHNCMRLVQISFLPLML